MTTSEQPEGDTDQDFPQPGTEWHVGPPDAPWWKFKVAQTVHRVASAPIVEKLPGAEAARNWAFGITVLSRDFTEVPPDA